MRYQVGDIIRIDHMEGEPQYTGREGKIERISKDCYGEIRFDGTWGGCAVYPMQDRFTVIKKGEQK